MSFSIRRYNNAGLRKFAHSLSKADCETYYYKNLPRVLCQTKHKDISCWLKEKEGLFSHIYHMLGLVNTNAFSECHMALLGKRDGHAKVPYGRGKKTF